MSLLRSTLFSLLLGASRSQQACYEKLSAKSGIIQSPNYPSNYPPNTDCYWEFMATEDAGCVLFTVEDFVVPSQNEDICPGDHFVLESCGSWWSISPERYYCGDLTETIARRGSFNLVQHFQINATSLRVSFHSDSVDEGKGFLMQYEILPSSECRQWGSPGYTKVKADDGSSYNCLTVMDDVTGSFNTPGYPDSYPSETDCAYGFKKPSPEYCGVLIRTTKFDLEARDGSSCHDYFGMPGCAKLCGRHEKPDILFFEYQKDADLMFLQFSSDFSVEGRGFKIRFEQVTDCFNPHQLECPNDQLNFFATPSECPYAERHECVGNNDCADGQICCFDGCLRSCKTPVSSVRRRRQTYGLFNLLVETQIDQFNETARFPIGYPHEPVSNRNNFIQVP